MSELSEIFERSVAEATFDFLREITTAANSAVLSLTGMMNTEGCRNLRIVNISLRMNEEGSEMEVSIKGFREDLSPFMWYENLSELVITKLGDGIVLVSRKHPGIVLYPKNQV